VGSVKYLCKRAFLNASPRIVEGMYMCNLTATSPETYGIVYTLINKCRGRVVDEDVQEGTNYYLLEVMLPLAESFEFTKMVMSQCSGMTYP
jgi:ribosome assembly protein 1